MIRRADIMFSAAAILQGSLLFTTIITGVVGAECWMTFAAAIVPGVLTALMYGALSESFPGENLFGVFDKVFPVWLSKTLCVFYTVYFLCAAAFNINGVSKFFIGYIAPETPSAAITAAMLFVCALAVKSGYENIMRMSILIVVFTAIFVALNCILLIYKVDPENFLPFFTKKLPEYIQSTHTSLCEPFGELLALTMFAESFEKKGVKKAWVSGALLGGGILLVIILRSVAVLGVTISIASVPSYETLRMIDVKNTLTRIETLDSFVIAGVCFFRISLIYAAAVRAAEQTAGIKKAPSLVYVTGALTACLAELSFESGFDGIRWGANYLAFSATPFVIVIPLITLLVGGRKKCLSQ